MGSSELISYAVLGGTALYCRFQTEIHADPLDLVAYAVTGMTSVLALYHASEPRNSNIETYKTCAEYIETFTYPCLVGYLWLAYGEERYIAYAHPVSLLVLRIVGNGMLGFEVDQVMETAYTLNECSAVYLSYIKQNPYAMAGTAVFFAMEMGLEFHEHMPIASTELLNYGLSVILVLFTLAYKHVGKAA